MMAKFVSLKNQSSKGFTFIELLISIALSTFLIASTVALFFVIKRAYLNQDGLSYLQENARSLSTLLESAISESGSMGCNHLRDITLNLHKGVEAKKIGLETKEGISALQDGAVKSREGSDVLWIQKVKEIYFLMQEMNNIPGTIYLKGKVPIIKGEIIALFDCASADLFRVQEEPVFSRAYGVTEIKTNILQEDLSLKQHDKHLRVGVFSSCFYYVAATKRKKGNSPTYALYKKEIGKRKQELIEGVEYLKILFAVKKDNAISYQSVVIDPLSKVIGVRVEALLSTVEEVLDKPEPYQLNGHKITPLDSKRRVWFTYEWKI